MDPLDPLTEIINSGQAFSPSILTERIVWVIIGFFFFAAIAKSIINAIPNQYLIKKKSVYEPSKTECNEDEHS